jgi:2-polyprenyl-6-methoxyphenol hydroxylase-like FAD-dependent oxidoreductase
MEIAINCAGIAGPTLAYWLSEVGHDVLLVEQAPALRSGGYVIDFWGLGYDIAEKMALIPQIKALGYQVQEVRFVDAKGRESGGFQADVFERMTGGRFTSLRRSDLSATIFGALDGRCETRFGDSIAGLEERDDHVLVRFEAAAPREFDLVIGADGLHSRVRELAFGEESTYEFELGYHVGAFELEGYAPRDALVYVSHGLPGRQVSRFAMREIRTLILFMFRDEFLPESRPVDDAERKAALRQVFGDTGWECPQILDAMKRVEEIYFDRVSQIRMPCWTKGRTALLGDAAACVSLMAGEGTGLAMAEAYVLAGELERCGGDYAAAFARYETLLMPFLAQKQRSAAKFASAFAPKTALGLNVRNLVSRLLGIPAVADYFVGRDLRDNLELPD